MKVRSSQPAAASSRRRLSLGTLTIAILLPAAAAGAEECEFFDTGTNEFVDGRCSIEYQGDTEIITLGKDQAKFVMSARQGQWSTGTLDGKPAIRYEIDRTRFSYATQDLTRFIERSDE